MDASVDSLEPPAIPDLETVNSAAPKIDEEDAEFLSLPAQSQPSAPKQMLKRTYSKIEPNHEMIPAPTTKRQKMNLLVSFKRLSFKMRRR